MNLICNRAIAFELPPKFIVLPVNLLSIFCSLQQGGCIEHEMVV